VSGNDWWGFEAGTEFEVLEDMKLFRHRSSIVILSRFSKNPILRSLQYALLAIVAALVTAAWMVAIDSSAWAETMANTTGMLDDLSSDPLIYSARPAPVPPRAPAPAQPSPPQAVPSQAQPPRLPVVSQPAPEPARRRGPVQTGIASHYWQPQRVGCRPYGNFNPQAMTAAHKTLPCGSKVRVTNKRTGRSVIVTINDRGPYVAGRIIDLSTASFKSINNGSTAVGVLTVSVEPL